MEPKESLYQTLDRIDGRGYKAYQELEGRWFQFQRFTVGIPYVQRDPFATPSKVLIRVKKKEAAFPSFITNRLQVTALSDYLTRAVLAAIHGSISQRRGHGKSGQIQVAPPGQEVLERTSVQVGREDLELRLTFGLPAQGRRVLGRQAQKMFFEDLPRLVKGSLFYSPTDEARLSEHVFTIEDQHFLREGLKERGLVAFVKNGSILPRRSGIHDVPLQGKGVIPFLSPPELQVQFTLPNQGPVSGMGIPQGVTLIVGGGYHGKSTLLEALERGVYNHFPGDGREGVVTRADAVKIRSEDGRRVEKVDIRPFIGRLPQGQKTHAFCTENASGSTSQAANIMEALEMGTSLLLIDEDTCATNFMLRDVRMQQLVAKEKEPITPFIDQVSPLFSTLGVSTILVVGGAGDYFDVADQVVMMDAYRPQDVTDQAHQIAVRFPSHRQLEEGNSFTTLPCRFPCSESIDPWKGKKVKVRSQGKDTILFGGDVLELGALEQLVSDHQTRAIGDLLLYGVKKQLFSQDRSLSDILTGLDMLLDEEGLEVISPFSAPEGDYARPRRFEVGAALNRLRTLKVLSSRDSRE